MKVSKVLLLIEHFKFPLKFHRNLKPRLYALSLPLGVNLPLWVNICPTLLNTPMGKWLRLYVF